VKPPTAPAIPAQAALSVAAPTHANADGNLTAVFFECCESPASQGSWDTVEIRWRLVDNEKDTDRFAVVMLGNTSNGASKVGTCKSPMDCEQYIAMDVHAHKVIIPEGIHYWTRLRSSPDNITLDWQYQGRTYDGDADGQLEILICGSLTQYETSSWYSYSCDPSVVCNIVAHPCCVEGKCVTGDSGVPSSIGSWNSVGSAGATSASIG
jgi:hypothetical protein